MANQRDDPKSEVDRANEIMTEELIYGHHWVPETDYESPKEPEEGKVDPEVRTMIY